MTPHSRSNFLERLRGLWKKVPTHRALRNDSVATGVLAVSKPILAFTSTQLPSPPNFGESTIISTMYRNTSDAAQTFLPPVQAVADAIPGVGGIIKGLIGGVLGTLQLVDRYIQNKDDIEQLTIRLHLLLHLIDSVPVSRTAFEETMRQRLLRALETAKSDLEKIEKRIHSSPSLTQDITGIITRVNNHLLEHTVFALMYLQNDVDEIKASADKIAQSSFKQIQFLENFMATAGIEQSQIVSRGHAILVDATGREHAMLLDQCRYLDQLDALLPVILFQCRPDEAEIQRWYIERKQYDFVMYNRTNSDVIQLTRESDTWSNLRPGTRIVLRVITEEVVDSILTATYKCPCGTPNTIDVRIEDVAAALQHGCTITCGHCERRFQIIRSEEELSSQNNSNVDSQRRSDRTPRAEAKSLIRNFLARQSIPPASPVPFSGGTKHTPYRQILNNYLQRVHRDAAGRRLTWKTSYEGPVNQPTWLAIAYLHEVEWGRGTGPSRGSAMESAAKKVLVALGLMFQPK